MSKVEDITGAGITHVWLPPPSHSIAEQGALPLFVQIPTLHSLYYYGKLHTCANL
jgi:hypothetical protein